MVNAAGHSAVAHARTHVVGEVRLNAEEQRRRTSAEAAIRLHGYQAVELQVRSSHMWRVTRAKIDAAKSWRKNEFPSTAVLNILPADRAFDTSRMVHCVAMYSHFVVRTPEVQRVYASTARTSRSRWVNAYISQRQSCQRYVMTFCGCQGVPSVCHTHGWCINRFMLMRSLRFKNMSHSATHTAISLWPCAG